MWICNNSQYGEAMSVFVNHEFVFSVLRGQSRSITVAKLHSLAVTNEGKHEVKGTFHIAVHRKLSFVSEEQFDISALENARFFFSDEKGYPLSSEQEKITCREKRDSSEQKRRRIVLPNRETILLQEIQFVQEGYVCLEFEDCIIGPFAFSHEETYLLYAPIHTIVNTAIENVHCYEEFLQSNEKEVCFIVNLIISFDMTIEVLKDENRSINGTFGMPRRKSSVTTVGTPIPVWTDTSTFAINGTIVVENNGTIGVSATASLEVKGTAVTDFTGGPGEAQSITLNNIESIAIAGAGGTGTASVKVAFSLNYKF
nr:S-Ena type endospore appendage [Priestia filamentosa]